MKKAVGREGNSTEITVLSVGPAENDHAALSEIFAGSQWPLCPGFKFTLKTARTLSTALSVLKKGGVPMVVSETELGAASWRELLDQAAQLPEAPSLIVTSRLADECLWAEALNLGAYDVLAKPFDADEVVRTLSQAWLHRLYQRQNGQRTLSAVGHPAPSLTTQRPVAV